VTGEGGGVGEMQTRLVSSICCGIGRRKGIRGYGRQREGQRERNGDLRLPVPVEFIVGVCGLRREIWGAWRYLR
jgi:hypothetical protein